MTINSVGGIIITLVLKCEEEFFLAVIPGSHDKRRMVRDSLLLTLKMEEGAHEPRIAVGL